MFAAFLTVAVFGRDEDSSLLDLRQQDVDECVMLILACLENGVIIFTPHLSEVILEISISDR